MTDRIDALRREVHLSDAVPARGMTMAMFDALRAAEDRRGARWVSGHGPRGRHRLGAAGPGEAAVVQHSLKSLHGISGFAR